MVYCMEPFEIFVFLNDAVLESLAYSPCLLRSIMIDDQDTSFWQFPTLFRDLHQVVGMAIRWKASFFWHFRSVRALGVFWWTWSVSCGWSWKAAINEMSEIYYVPTYLPSWCWNSLKKSRNSWNSRYFSKGSKTFTPFFLGSRFEQIAAVSLGAPSGALELWR